MSVVGATVAPAASPGACGRAQPAGRVPGQPGWTALTWADAFRRFRNHREALTPQGTAG